MITGNDRDRAHRCSAVSRIFGVSRFSVDQLRTPRNKLQERGSLIPILSEFMHKESIDQVELISQQLAPR
jgi:hypothetical protein